MDALTVVVIAIDGLPANIMCGTIIISARPPKMSGKMFKKPHEFQRAAHQYALPEIYCALGVRHKWRSTLNFGSQISRSAERVGQV